MIRGTSHRSRRIRRTPRTRCQPAASIRPSRVTPRAEEIERRCSTCTYEGAESPEVGEASTSTRHGSSRIVVVNGHTRASGPRMRGPPTMSAGRLNADLTPIGVPISMIHTSPGVTDRSEPRRDRPQRSATPEARLLVGRQCLLKDRIGAFPGLFAGSIDGIPCCDAHSNRRSN